VSLSTRSAPIPPTSAPTADHAERVPSREPGGFRHELRAIGVLWRRELLRLVHNRLQLSVMLVNPLLFLLVLGTGLDSMLGGAPGGDYRRHLFPGVLLMAVQLPALGAGVAIVRDREAGFLRGVLVAPVGRGTILVGACLGGATAATAQGAVLLALAGLAGLPYRPVVVALLLGELALIAFTMTVLSALVAVFVTRMETFQTLLSLAMMPLFFLSGALFTVDGLPGWLTALTLANPLSYAVDALRRTAALALPPDQAPAALALAGWTPPVALEIVVMLLAGLLALTLAARRFARTG
jgi:ABC-type multidrug transport system, permease component